MAKPRYVKAEPERLPQLRLGAAVLWGAILGLSGIVAGVFATLYPNARLYLWLLAALCMAGIAGLIAYYFIERMRPSRDRAILMAVIPTALSAFLLTVLIGNKLEDKGPPDFSRVPIKHGALKVAFYGALKPPTLLGGANVYRPNFNCTFMQGATAPTPNGPWTGAVQYLTCSIFIVWRRPIDADRISVDVDGKPLYSGPPAKNEFYSPYVTLFTVNGVPPVGLMTISVDAKDSGAAS